MNKSTKEVRAVLRVVGRALCGLALGVAAINAAAQGDREDRATEHGKTPQAESHKSNAGERLAQGRERGGKNDRDEDRERDERLPRVQVSLDAPAAGAVFNVPATIGLSPSVTVTPSRMTILRVEYYANGALVGTASAAPYSFSWANVAPGSYTLTARAYATVPAERRERDEDRGRGERDEREPVWQGMSAPVAIRVNAPPTVSLAAPASGSVFNPPANITLTANAADSDGTVAEVDFYAGGTLVGTATAAPYSVTWANPAPGTYSLTAVATDNDGASTTSSAASIRVNAPPTVSLAAPASGSVFNPPANITLTANAADSDGVIAKVDFYAGSALIGTATSSPFSITWTNPTPGTYNLTAVATDNDGANTRSPAASIRVNAPPTVSLTAPVVGLAGTAPATVTVSANAADSDGTVARVDFYAGTTLIGTATAAPYSIGWVNVAAGNYTVAAIATDNDGASTTSAAVAIRVNAPPTVSLTAPAAGLAGTAPATIVVSANAADSDGTVAKVDFYAGTTLIGTATAAPYAIQWSNAAAGSYNVTAIATDNDGAATTSAAAAIRVNAPPTVSVTTPAANAVVNAGATVTVSADVADSDGTIAKVDFYAGTTLIGTATAAPYSVSWASVAAGNYSLTAIATDSDGATTASAPVSLLVNALPTVSISAPASGASFNTPANVTVTADAADPDGTIAKVDFYAGTTLIGTATAAPYTIQWTNAAAGSYSVTAVATDNQSGTTTSAAVAVTVKSSSNNAAFVSQAVPANMAPGGTYTVSVTMQNTGATTWTAASLYQLSAQNPQDNTTWGRARVQLPYSVAPGASVIFSFQVTAPNTAGSYNFQWRMVQDGVEWFGNASTNVAVAVVAPTSPPNYAGWLESADCSSFSGWAVDSTQPNAPITVDIYVDTTLVMSVLASNYRADLIGAVVGPNVHLTNGNHGFSVPTPAFAIDSRQHVITVKGDGTQQALVSWGVIKVDCVARGVAANNGATYISQSAPPALVAPGQSYPVTVTMQNTGNTTWTTANSYALASLNPANNTTWGTSRAALPNDVAPGATVTIGFNVTAPATMGTYNFQWQMVQDGGVGVFGNTTPNVSVKDGADNATFVSQNVPGIMAQGQSYAVSVTMQNTGNTTWKASSGYRLVSQNPAGNSTWSVSQAALPNDVAPGNSVTISFNVTSPAARGTYNFQWRMTHDGYAAFGDTTANVAVADGVDGATFVSQSVPLSMVPGQSYAVSVTMQNSGNTTWTSAEQIALASQNPQDNTNWGLARVQLPADVAPGASVTLSFNAVAPAAVGVYSFRWRMVRGAMGFGDASADAAVHVGVAPANVYFIEPDHLGTPRLIADENQKTVWRWDQAEPFGNNPPNEDPDGDGVAFDFPMRFPGQYFDRETNLNYNYFRDYSADTGRYVESDPIGLRGRSLNTYAYVNGNPLRYIDTQGLEAEVCVRPFYPVPVPLARHCFVRFNQNDQDTSSYDPEGTHSDPAPSWWPKSCRATQGTENDDCVKKEMAKCRAEDYDFTGNNCCHCVERALQACGLRLPVRDWPNWPVNPGPQPGEQGATR